METPSSKSRWSRLSAIDGSFACLFILIFFDGVLSATYMFSLLVCPVWFLVAVIRAIVQRPGWGLAAARIAMPLVAFLLVTANSSVQNRIATTNAERIIQACDDYREANGTYPERLDDLVPRHLSSVPRAKYCWMWGDFLYFGKWESPFFWWYEIPPHGRRIYTFETGEWGYLD